MLRILGSTRKLCDGVSRRDLLRVGGLGLAGASLGELMDWRSASAATNAPAGEFRGPTFGKAKNLILIHLYGSPSQLETVDPKPLAPLEIRGDLGCIPSSLPELQVCELLPKFGQVMDRCAILRSITHPYPLHGVAFALTGVPAIDVAMELSPQDSRHWPYFGSVVDFVDSKQAGPSAPSRTIPGNLALPFQFSSRRVGEVPRAGPYAAFLGGEFNPVWTDFVGQATRGITKTLRDMTYVDNDPYIGCSEDSHFVVPSATSLQAEISLDRLNRRRSLVSQLDQARADLNSTGGGKQFDRYRDMTYNVLMSDALRNSLDTRLEPANTRALYGDTLFGQSLLAARRVVEAGGRVVSVFWDEYGLAGTGWDTHWNHYPRMKEELCPGLDQGWFGLITDLEQRGLMDETLVVLTSEHGRTPRVTSGMGGGRDHWSRVYSSLLAGAGVARGKIVGASDKHGGEVADRPISPKDLLATMYHLLGIDHRMMIQDHLGRPLPLVEGEVIGEALA